LKDKASARKDSSASSASSILNLDFLTRLNNEDEDNNRRNNGPSKEKKVI
jgi:hypothetical protein